ncbi:MAG: HTTM domain-containing protein [Acidimicrobiales bacterium]
MRRLPGWWEDFWFAPTPTSTLAVVRIGYGVLLLAWSLLLSADLFTFFSDSGLLPEKPPITWTWTVLDVFPSKTAIAVLFALQVAAAVCLIVGYRTRLAAVVALVGLTSFQIRNPVVFNSADILLRLFGLYLVFAPAGVALSVDRWRRHRDRFWEFPLRAPWAVRLMQVQLSAVYLFTVWLKLRGTTWNEGTAVSYAMRVGEVARFDVPLWVTNWAPLANLLTYTTLAIEVALALFVWNRRARPWVLGAGVLLHLSILLTVMVGLFSFTMFLGYLAFVPPETMTRVLAGLRSRLKGARWRPLRALGSAGPEPPSRAQRRKAPREVATA